MWIRSGLTVLPFSVVGYEHEAYWVLSLGRRHLSLLYIVFLLDLSSLNHDHTRLDWGSYSPQYSTSIVIDRHNLKVYRLVNIVLFFHNDQII